MLTLLVMLLAGGPTSPDAIATHATGPDIALSNRDYPREARVKRETGRTITRFLIDETGKARSCEIVQSSGSALLDARSCEIAMRARWRPARDAHGNPMPESWRWAINWRISRQPEINVEAPEPESVASRRSLTAKAVPAVIVGKANWAAMPPIKLRQTAFNPDRVSEEVRQIIAGNRCALPGARPNRYDLVVHYALLLSSNGAERALVEDIGCRPIETIVGSMITAPARLENVEPAAGATKQWHWGRVRFRTD